MSHKEKFMSAICNCGQHKNNSHVSESAPLSGTSEYSKNFVNYPTQQRVLGKPLPQELKVGGAFNGTTESRTQFTEHQIPEKFQMKKYQYVPNPSPLEGITTQKSDFPSWPDVKPPHKKARDVWKGSSGTFDGNTTNKLDYKDFGVQPPRFRHEVPPYAKNPAKFEGISTQSSDYKKQEILSRPLGKHSDPYNCVPDDRDFKSTVASSYTGQSAQRVLVKALREYVPSAAKFEGISASKDSYQAWEMPARYRHEKAKYVPNDTPFEKNSSYSADFKPKVTELYHHPIPTYMPLSTAKFDAKSTNQSDFLDTGKIVRVKDFSPRNVYEYKPDDRDFVSTTRGSHTQKPLRGCPAADYAASVTSTHA